MKPTGFRKRSNSVKDDEDSEGLTISSIIQQLSVVHSTMSQHGMEEGLIHQVVKQMFYLVGAVSLNNIMLRKDMCSCRKGMQIRSAASFQTGSFFLGDTNRQLAAILNDFLFLSRCNISYLDEWLKERKLQSSDAIHTLKPLSQAAWLLQVNKSTDDDAKEIAEKCTELRPVQVPLQNQCFNGKFVGNALHDTLPKESPLIFKSANVSRWFVTCCYINAFIYILHFTSKTYDLKVLTVHR